MSGKSRGKNGDSSKKPKESANEPAEVEDHSAADGPVGDSAPGAGHHPSDDAAAAEEGEAVAEAVSEPDAPTEGGGAPADAPTEDQEKPAAKAEAESKPETEPKPDAKAEPEAKAEPGAKAEPEPEPKAEPAAPEQETLHGQPLVDSFGQAVVHCDRAAYLELCQALRADGYDMIIGVCGVDYLVHPGRSLPDGVTPERFEVVVELAAVATRRRIRVRCQVPADEPSVPSLFDVWPGTEAHEREAYDMYGIVFEGHPDPSRILMPEDWEGHPLRKDYATGRIPVQFKETPGGR